MQFSNDGSLFALFSRKNKFLKLYKNNDILNLIKMIKKNQMIEIQLASEEKVQGITFGKD